MPDYLLDDAPCDQLEIEHIYYFILGEWTTNPFSRSLCVSSIFFAERVSERASSAVSSSSCPRWLAFIAASTYT